LVLAESNSGDKSPHALAGPRRLRRPCCPTPACLFKGVQGVQCPEHLNTVEHLQQGVRDRAGGVEAAALRRCGQAERERCTGTTAPIPGAL